MDRLKSEYSRLIEEKDALTERLAKTLITHKYSESLSAVKDRLKVKSLKKDTSDTASDENISEENE